MEIKPGEVIYKKTEDPKIFDSFALDHNEIIIDRLEKKIKSLKQLIANPSVLQKDLDNAEELLKKLKELK